MTEGIAYNDLGTIDVTFDDKTYHLGRPKMRQFRYFTEKLETQRQEVRDKLDVLQKKAKDEPENLDYVAELAKMGRNPFYDRTIPILAEMFTQLGDPLPTDPDEWPAWLAADQSLVADILTHWRTHPKVSGAEPSP